ncbi:hypothetical protein [Myxococcus sp. RHSTA-1-4]|uniref:hypothetical protein n=1 Tax=Myxococcus sp. RHSTA-1-4 TaxID=2874601 RepID=UPI001CBCC71A|nr:hypothetical protein [Myxococcus sp. RHSTA-1-4]MBZ4423018.1 hypothetical protein [Myxococcus sp. RHSTA-1-4]
MSEHLSNLVLDELTVGSRPPPSHLDACEECRARLARRRERGVALRATPEFSRGKARILAHAEAAAPARPWFSWVRLAAPLAMAMSLAVLVWVGSPSEGTRIKGGPFVSLVRLRDGAVDAPLSPGDVVTLSVHAAPHRYAFVLVTDAGGATAPLWPSRGDRSGDPVEVPASPTFVITPGDFMLDAFFSDEPLPLARVREAVARAVAGCEERGRPADCAPPSEVKGLARHYRLSVTVSPAP